MIITHLSATVPEVVFTQDHCFLTTPLSHVWRLHPFLQRVANIEVPVDPETGEPLIIATLFSPDKTRWHWVGFAARVGVTARIRKSHATAIVHTDLIARPARLADGLRLWVARTARRLRADGQDARAEALEGWRWGRLVLDIP